MLQNRTSLELKTNQIFLGIKETLVSSIFNPKKFIQFNEGNIIYQNGDSSNGLYLIIKGDVKIKYSNSNYISNKGVNQFFGEKEILEDTKRISSAVANRNTVLYLLDRNLFKRLYTNYREVKNNIEQFGELEIPEMQVEQKVNLRINENSKPISFKAVSSNEIKEQPGNGVELNIDNLNLTPPEEKVETDAGQNQIPEEMQIAPESSVNPQSFDEINSKEEIKPAVPETKQVIPGEQDADKNNYQENKTEDHSTEFERENFRKILACVGVIHQGLSLFETTQSIAKALKELTLSEVVEVFLVNESSFEMKKFQISGESFVEEKFNSAEGLTGSCLLQKKVINLARPTEDSRYIQKIDQPGNSRIKSILYFPVVNERGETVAVIQLGRENKKFGETEISNLNIVSKQIEIAIYRAWHLQQVFVDERRITIGSLSHTIINEIQTPISIINNYVEILHEKELPEGADDVIRMLQKQANSIEDLLISLFEHIRNEIKVELKEIHFNEFIDDVLELISEYCESKEIKLFKKVGESIIVSIDRAKLFTAIYQVIRQFSEQFGKGGKIYISSDVFDNSIVLMLKNEPANFLKESINKLLEKSITGEFRQDPNSEYEIARRIVEAHSGSFNIELNKSEGTIITITLPGIDL